MGSGGLARLSRGGPAGRRRRRASVKVRGARTGGGGRQGRTPPADLTLQAAAVGAVARGRRHSFTRLWRLGRAAAGAAAASV